MVVGEQIILDYLDRRGVLVPRSDFARVAINDTNLGVFRYETQPEESLLRMHRREPGSMYSGDLPGSARTEELWTGITRWRKVAWRDEAAKDDYSELERLLAHVRGSTIAEFADFARHEIDIDAFASSMRSTWRSAATSTTSAKTTSSTSTRTAAAGSPSPGAFAASNTMRSSIAWKIRCCCGSSSCRAISRCAIGCSTSS